MYDWLLFLHLIAAFLLAVTVVMYSAVALGAAAPGRTLFVADRCWDVGGLGHPDLRHLARAQPRPVRLLRRLDPRRARALVRRDRARPDVQRRMAARRDEPRSATMHWIRTLVVHRPARPHDLEAGRMSVLAAIRPDDWNLALFVHILGAMVLVGSLALVATSLAARQPSAGLPLAPHRRDPRLDRHARCRSVDRSRRRRLNDIDPTPAWVDIGFSIGDPMLLFIIIATVCAGLAARRRARGGGCGRRRSCSSASCSWRTSSPSGP